MSEENNHSRQPKNMQGVLQMAIAATDSTEAEEDSRPSVSTMTAERRKWLSEALDGCVRDMTAELKSAIQALQEAGVDEQELVLDTIIDLVDSIDVANDFEKLGGLDTLRPLLHSSHAGLRSRAAHLFGELVQNNPHCQLSVLRLAVLQDLLTLVDTDADDTTRVQALFAISCLVRECSEAQSQFLELDGVSVLLRAIQGNIEKLKIKSAFLLSNVCQQNSHFRDVMCDMGFVEQLISLVREEHNASHEYILGCIVSLCEESSACASRAVRECRRPELQFHVLLQSRVQLLANREEFQEELDYCNALKRILFPADHEEER